MTAARSPPFQIDDRLIGKPCPAAILDLDHPQIGIAGKPTRDHRLDMRLVRRRAARTAQPGTAAVRSHGRLIKQRVAVKMADLDQNAAGITLAAPAQESRKTGDVAGADSGRGAHFGPETGLHRNHPCRR